MPDPKQHAEDRNLVEKILRKIPGFRGYLEKEYRRDSDRLQREWLVDRLEQSKRGIDSATRSLVDAGQIDVLPEFDRLRGKLDTLIARIRGAMRGYSGVFDLVRVDEAVLDRVYEFDAQLIDRVDGLANAIEDLPNFTGKVSEQVRAIRNTVDSIDEAWDGRDDILKGID